MGGAWQETSTDGVLIAAYDNPPMNYYEEADFDALDRVIDHVAESGARALVLCGRTPGRFITHFSVEQILAGLQDPQTLVERGPERNLRVHALTGRLTELPVPVIAALNGDAMGFGLELALACDLRIAQKGDYRLGLPEVRLGILPGGGGTQRLARLVGQTKALELILRARVVSPDEALAIGFVNEVVDDAVSRAVDVAREIAILPPVAVAMAKRAIHEGSELPLAAALRLEADASMRSKLAPGALNACSDYVSLPLMERRDWLEGRQK